MKNVSQYVNGHRIAEACRFLKGAGQPVTAVMFESGFQTKSNFQPGIPARDLTQSSRLA
jgi:AraC-like DNA-binding protein